MFNMDLVSCKKNLSNALGDEMKTFPVKILITKHEMLGENTVHLHNQFLLAILGKCQSLITSMSSTREQVTSVADSKTSKLSKKSASARSKRRPHPTRSGFQQRFCPVNPLQHVLPVSLSAPEPEDKPLNFAQKEMTLPDIGMVHGRMIITAWDAGLDNVEDDAVRIMMQAIEGRSYCYI